MSRLLLQPIDSVELEEFADGNPRRIPKISHTVVLPEPPSVNAIWKFVGSRALGKRVIRTPDYERWLKTCDGCVLEQLGIPAYRFMIRGRYAIELTLSADRFGKIDQDNCIKAASDFMQRARLIENDRWAWRTVIQWGDDLSTKSSTGSTANCRVIVTAC